MPGLIARVAVAAALAATAYVAAPDAPAAAAGCASGDGVTVVVDYHGLGGGVQEVCVAGGGGAKASSLFPDAGFALTYVQRQPGFVCRVAGKPADNPCVNTPPADAYWGLYWSDGESGGWTYSSTGVGGLSVPDGGSVAFSWHGGGSAPPGTSPAVHTGSSPTAAPTTKPTKQPSGQPSGQPSSPSSGQPGQESSTPSSPSDAATASASPSASGSPAAGEKGKRDRKPGRDATIGATASAPSASDETDDEVAPTSAEPSDPADDGLPAWVAPVAVLVLFGAAGGVALARRRRTPGSGAP